MSQTTIFTTKYMKGLKHTLLISLIKILNQFYIYQFESGERLQQRKYIERNRGMVTKAEPIALL